MSHASYLCATTVAWRMPASVPIGADLSSRGAFVVGDWTVASGSRRQHGKRGQSLAKKVRLQHEKLEVLCRPVVRRQAIKGLAKEEVQAMVDLAYWSESDTSRRDAASAFVTLSMMNDVTMDVLDGAGVLGAVLVLIARGVSSVRDKRPLNKTSADCLQDALLCLRSLLRRDDVKSRFLEAPGGLMNVLALTDSDEDSLRLSVVQILDTLCEFPPAQVAVVYAGGPRVLVAQLSSNDKPLRRTAGRVVRRLSRSPHTTAKSMMDADIVRFLICLMGEEDNDKPTEEQEEIMCIAYFTKVSSDEEACAELAELGLSRYLMRILPERRLPLQNRLAMLQALERMSRSTRCEARLVNEGLFEALVKWCFNEVASLAQDCQDNLRQCHDSERAATMVPSAKSEHRISVPRCPPTGWSKWEEGIGGSDQKCNNGGRSTSVVFTGGVPGGVGIGWRKKKDVEGARFSEDNLEVAMDVARTCMSMFVYLVTHGYWQRALHAGVLAHANSVPIGAGDDPHVTGSLSRLVFELSRFALTSEEGRLSFVAQGPLDAVLRCLRLGKVAQQQCALDTLTNICAVNEMKVLVFSQEVLNEVLELAAVQENVPFAAGVLFQFSLIPEWRLPLVRGGCLRLLVDAITHATGPVASPTELVVSLLRSAVATIRQITKLEGSGREVINAGGLPQLIRLSRADQEASIQRDARHALENIGHIGSHRDEERRKRGDEEENSAITVVTD